MREFGDGVEEVDPQSWYLTQSEEYGRRLHADERRLAYVALTRARNDALLTYCRYTGESSRDCTNVPKGSRAASPSNFWLEVHDALHGHDHAIEAQAYVEGLGSEVALVSPQGDPIDPPEASSWGRTPNSTVMLWLATHGVRRWNRPPAGMHCHGRRHWAKTPRNI